MSRSGYSDQIWEDGNAGHLYRGAVDKAMNGARGQAFLREFVQVLDAMPRKRLIGNAVEDSADRCSLGAVGLARGVDVLAAARERAVETAAYRVKWYHEQEAGSVQTALEEELDEGNWPAEAASVLGIAISMAREIVNENDNDNSTRFESPEMRWERMRKWAIRLLK